MQALTSSPETDAPPVDQVAIARRRARRVRRADLAVMIAIPAPMALIALLVLAGTGVLGAVGATFVLVFAVSRTLDVRWRLRERRRRSTHQLSERRP